MTGPTLLLGSLTLSPPEGGVGAPAAASLSRGRPRRYTSCRSRSGCGHRRTTRRRLTFSHELVDAAFLGQSGVDVAARVDADAVVMATVEAGEHRSSSIADADLRGLAAVFLLGDVEIAILAAGDVVRPAHAGPHAEEVAIRREYLDALVGPVGDVELAVRVERDAVRQVELALAMARRAPRLDQPSVAGEAVHAGVAVAVGHVNVAVGVADHLGRVIERPRCAFRQPVGNVAGVGMDAALAERQQRLAVQGERLRHRVAAIGGVDDVVDDFQPVRVGDLAAAPRAQVLAFAVEHHHRRILALEYVDAVLRVGRHPADHPELFSRRQFGKIVDHLVGIFARANLCHGCLPPGKMSTNVPSAAYRGTMPIQNMVLLLISISYLRM